jgi:signal transduction histidine kinase
VVLLVSRADPQPFTPGELELLLTFANHAALAWEHAVLYERSDERLREVARENERLYHQAMQANQFKSTLLAAVGHELRTPLAGIKGHASTLLEDDVDWSPAEQRHFLTTISTEADRLAGLVSNLLDLSRLEAGLLLLHPSAWAIDDLIDMALARLGQPVPGLRRSLPPDLPPVAVDRPRLEVALRNLIANALAYGDGGVWVSAEAGDGLVTVRVCDDGPGIAPEDLPHIFERFYRARHGVSRRAGGSGLGLAICKAFIEAHGGRIWAESDGRGTTFCLTLPAADVPANDHELTGSLQEVR